MQGELKEETPTQKLNGFSTTFLLTLLVSNTVDILSMGGTKLKMVPSLIPVHALNH